MAGRPRVSTSFPYKTSSQPLLVVEKPGVVGGQAPPAAVAEYGRDALVREHLHDHAGARGRGRHGHIRLQRRGGPAPPPRRVFLQPTEAGKRSCRGKRWRLGGGRPFKKKKQVMVEVHTLATQD